MITDSDSGAAFTSRLFQDFVDKNGMTHHPTAVAMPSENGQVERYNRTILQYLAEMCGSTSVKRWNEHLGKLQVGLNNTINKAWVFLLARH